jgi:hypothetical protein
MTGLTPMLACRGPVITAGDLVILLLLAGAWLVAIVLCFVNLVLIFRLSRMFLFRLTHFLIYLSYICLATFLFCLSKIITRDDVAAPVAIILMIAVPVMVIGHFIYLLFYRRKLKREDVSS